MISVPANINVKPEMISMAEGRHVLLKIVHSLSTFWRKRGQTKQSERKPKAPGSGVKERASKQKNPVPHPLALSFDTRVR